MEVDFPPGSTSSSGWGWVYCPELGLLADCCKQSIMSAKMWLTISQSKSRKKVTKIWNYDFMKSLNVHGIVDYYVI